MVPDLPRTRWVFAVTSKTSVVPTSVLDSKFDELTVIDTVPGAVAVAAV